MRNLICTIIFLISSNVYAQTPVTGVYSMQNNGNFASTAEESALRGAGYLIQSQGMYLKDLGVYENLHQDAYSKFLDNNSKRIEHYWNGRAAYHQYLKEKYAQHPPAKRTLKDSGFVFFGTKFKNMEEWRNSKEYSILMDMHSIDESLNQLDNKSQEIIDKENNKTLYRFNKNRSFYSLNYGKK